MKPQMVRLFAALAALSLLTPGVSTAAASGAISGRVTDLAGTPLQGICVTAYRPPETLPQGGTLTDLDGRYRIEGLESGGHRVRFWDCADLGIVGEWYNDKPTYADATTISVGTGERTGIDARLARMGRITGRVRASNGSALEGICVTATGPRNRSVLTGSDGRYVIAKLPAGSYTVAFATCDALPYLPRWFSGSSTPAGADPVTVSDDTTSANIDATLTRGATVAGRITTLEGEPLQGCASAYDTRGRMVSHASTDLEGRYRLVKLAAGEHAVFLYDCSGGEHLGEWFDDAWERSNAEMVALTLGQDVVGINAELTLGGVVTGVIRDVGGRPLEGICVYRPGELNYPETYTDREGRYRFHGMKPGSWRFEFRDCNEGYYHLAEVHQEIQAAATHQVDVVMLAGLGPCSQYRDSDGDGLNDCRETELATDVNVVDSDRDGLGDGQEVDHLGTDPLDVDTDNDLFSDGFEVNGGSCLGVESQKSSDPTDARSTPYSPTYHGVTTLPETIDPIC